MVLVALVEHQCTRKSGSVGTCTGQGWLAQQLSLWRRSSASNEASIVRTIVHVASLSCRFVVAMLELW
jgi:hypothetical protein